MSESRSYTEPALRMSEQDLHSAAAFQMNRTVDSMVPHMVPHMQMNKAVDIMEPHIDPRIQMGKSMDTMGMVPHTEPAVQMHMSMEPHAQRAMQMYMNMDRHTESVIQMNKTMNIMEPHTEPGIQTSGSRVPHTQPGIQTSGTRVPHTEPGIETSGSRVPHTEPGIQTSGIMVPHTEPGIQTGGTRVPHTEPTIQTSSTMVPHTEPTIQTSSTIEPHTEPVVQTSVDTVPHTQSAIHTNTPINDLNDPSIEAIKSLKQKVQGICDELAQYGEESLILTINPWQQDSSYYGSEYGIEFLHSKLEIIQQFYHYCRGRYTGTEADQSDHVKITSIVKFTDTDPTIKQQRVRGKSTNENDTDPTINQQRVRESTKENDTDTTINQQGVRGKSTNENDTKDNKQRLESSGTSANETADLGDTKDVKVNDIPKQQEAKKSNKRERKKSSRKSSRPKQIIYGSELTDDDDDLTDDYMAVKDEDWIPDIEGSGSTGNHGKKTAAEKGTKKLTVRLTRTPILRSSKKPVATRKSGRYTKLKGGKVERKRNVTKSKGGNKIKVENDDIKPEDLREDGCVKNAKYTTRRLYSCEHCDKVYLTASRLSLHVRKEHEDLMVKHTCNVCNESFSKAKGLSRHRVNAGHAQACEICGKEFVHTPEFKSHLRHHKARQKKYEKEPVKCEHCEKEFWSKGDLNKHRRIHSNDKPWMCDTCGSQFALPSQLRCHKRSHTGERPYTCETCGKKFTLSNVLARHRRKHTGEKYQCHICGKQYASRWNLNIHVDFIHTGLTPFKCEFCGKEFNRKDNLKTHKKKHDREREKAASYNSNKRSNSPPKLPAPTPELYHQPERLPAPPVSADMYIRGLVESAVRMNEVDLLHHKPNITGHVPPAHGHVPPAHGQVPMAHGHVPTAHGQSQYYTY